MIGRGKFLALVPLLLAFVVLPDTQPMAAGKDDIRPWSGDMPVRGAWLRERLPDDTLAYLRLPHPLGFLAAPKGNSLDSALRSTANVRNLQAMQSALVENVLAELPGFDEAYIRALAARLRSPVELAVMLEPAPAVMLSINLDVESNGAFEQLIASVTVSGAPLSLLSPLDADGYGQVLGLPVPTAVHFDAASGRMLLQSGPAVTAEQFVAVHEAMADAVTHKMHAMETVIDSSGYGWFLWLDAERAIPAAQMFMDPEQSALLIESGLDKVRAAAIGWGAANRKGRLGIVLDMPRDGERQFLPYVQNTMSATAVGEPDLVALLSIPTAEEFSRIEAIALESASEESRASWQQGKAELERSTGIRIENVLQAIGPEVIGIFDQAGDYAAVRLRDVRLFDDFIRQVSANTGSSPGQTRVGRHVFHHWSLPGNAGQSGIERAGNAGPWSAILGRQREHLHWYQDGDFLYFASVPQPLLERIEAGARTDIGRWLAERQRMDMSSSLLALTSTSEKLPRRIYYLYLELLQAIADVSEADFDIWSMPTASQVSLPDKGALGFSVNLGDPYLSIELMFENNPFESLFSGDMASMAAAGIIAAIAIPAYQDYTIRASVSQGLAEANAAKAAVAAHFRDAGEFPGPGVAADISAQSTPGQHAQSITVVPGSGIIVISFSAEVLPGGGEIYLEPAATGDGLLSWRCSATLEDKHVPAACRGGTIPDLGTAGI